MPTNEPLKPTGEATGSVTRKAGNPKRATKATGKAMAKPDLDARHERVVRPRRAMGPPLGTVAMSTTAAAVPRRSREDVKSTDPAKPTKRAGKKA